MDRRANRIIESMAVASAALAVLVGPAAAQVEVVRTAPFEGGAPLAVAVDGSGRVYVPDLHSSVTYRFSPDLAPLDTLPSPGGGNPITGLAWSPATDRLYWADATASRLHETALDGSVIASRPIATPKIGGMVGALAFDASAGTLWCLDLVNDEVFEVNLDGTPAGSAPIPLPTGPGSYGLGIAWIPDGGEGTFEALCGDADAGRAARIVRFGPGGALPCSARDVGFLSGFLGGFAPRPPPGSYYLVDNGGLEVLEARAEGTAEVCPPDRLSCRAGGGVVDLRWDAADLDAIEVRRGGAAIAVLDGGSTSFEDRSASAGETVYQVIGISGDRRSYPAACGISVPAVSAPALPLSDAHGNRLMEAAIAFESIAAAGIRLDLQDEDGSIDVPLDFAFPFYGASFTSVAVGANGLLVFGGAASEPSNTEIPSAKVPDALVAPFWDDLDASAPGSGVFVLVSGDAPARTFAVEWSHVQFFPADEEEPNGDLSFQAILHEGSGRIDMVRGPMRGPEGDLACGATATVGIEGPGGADGILVSYNTCTVGDGTALTVIHSSDAPLFLRGDANADGSLDLADPIALLLHAFAGGALSCRAAADGNDDEILDLADAVLVLEYLFLEGPPPERPFDPRMDPAACAPDPAPAAGGALDCASFPPCGWTGRKP